MALAKPPRSCWVVGGACKERETQHKVSGERDRLGLFGFGGVVDKKKEVPYNCHERDAEEEEEWRMMEGGEGHLQVM